MDINMERAELRDAVLDQKFFFWINENEHTAEISELSCDEIINGGKGFFGLIPYMKMYIDDSQTDTRTQRQLMVIESLFVYSIRTIFYQGLSQFDFSPSKWKA